MRVEIKANVAEVAESVAQLAAGAPWRLSRALNISGSAGRAVTRDTIAADTGLDVTEVERSFLTERATEDEQAYQLTIRERFVPAIRFGAEQTSTGVEIRGGRVSLTGRFLATMPSGHRGVFGRTGTFGRRGKPYLERIAEVKIPVTDVMDAERAKNAMVSTVTAQFPDAVDREMTALVKTVGLAA